MADPIWKNPDAVTIPQLLTTAVQKWPDKPFLDIAGQTWTFADVERLSSRLANGLRDLGVRQGDRVCTFLDTSIDPILLWFAITRIGAVIVPINTAFKGSFLKHQVTDAQARIIIVESHYADRLEIFEDGASELKTIVYRGERPALDTKLEIRDLASVSSSDESAPDISLHPGDLASLIYTSGTTGPSKGCMLSHNQPCYAGIPTLANQGVTGDDILWTALPLFHLAALSMLMGCVRFGTTLALAPRFSVSGFWDEIERTGATALFALATMFPLLADAPETPAEKRCHGQLRVVFGVPFLREMQQRWQKRFGVRHTNPAGYGMTECAPIATYPGHEVPDGATGMPMECLDVRIVDDNNEEVPRGTPGEIVIRPKIPYVMFDGYWNRPDATAEATRGLWFHCGDIGKIDEQGYFYFVDRKKDYLRHRGENISSHELEMTFRTHPHVADVAIHSVPGISEDDVKATVIVREGAVLGEKELCLWAIENVPYFAVPRYIEFRTELPRNAIGRVLKFELRGEGVTPATWDREVAGIVVRR